MESIFRYTLSTKISARTHQQSPSCLRPPLYSASGYISLDIMINFLIGTGLECLLSPVNLQMY